MQNIEAFGEAISRPQRIVITTHIKPDADALGSSLALANYLIAKGHDVWECPIHASLDAPGSTSVAPIDKPIHATG